MAVNGSDACYVIACFFGRLVPSMQQFFMYCMHFLALLAESGNCDLSIVVPPSTMTVAFHDPFFSGLAAHPNSAILFFSGLAAYPNSARYAIACVFWHNSSVLSAFWVYTSPRVWGSLGFFCLGFFWRRD